MNFSVCEIIDVIILILCFSEILPVSDYKNLKNIIKTYLNTFARNLLPNIGKLISILDKLKQKEFYKTEYKKF